MLIGYLPVPKLDCETDVDQKRQTKRELFHKCMAELLEPLATACEKGGVEAACADGNVRRIHPVLASYIADFPEQCKVACTKQSHCPSCTVHPKCRGDPSDAALRTTQDVIRTMEEREGRGAKRFVRQGLVPVRPFWISHPYVDIGTLLTPDLLHQVHKGVMKDHLIKWVTHILEKPTLDERYVSMPDYNGLRHFKNGISSVSQWTGRELKEMVKILLPATEDSNPRVVRAARSLMDFMYLVHMASVTDDDLHAMEDALRTFHDHKDVFQALGAVVTDKGFHGIPKIHMISHYAHLIRQLGTPDGYNTETSERLHIDFAKMGYRASNRVNATKQMALYIQRMEAIAMHAAHLRQHHAPVPPRSTPLDQEQDFNDVAEDADEDRDEDEDEDWDCWLYEEVEDPTEMVDAGVIVEPNVALRGRDWEVSTAYYSDEGCGGEETERQVYHPNPEHVVANTPTIPGVLADYITSKQGAARFVPELHKFLDGEVKNYDYAPFTDQHRFNLWTRARLFHYPPPFNVAEGPWTDVIRAQTHKEDQRGRVTRRARFDTVLIESRKEKIGIHREYFNSYRFGLC